MSDTFVARVYNLNYEAMGDQSEWDAHGNAVMDLAREADAVAEELAARQGNERDARRYRWLREKYWDSGAICCVTEPKKVIRPGAYCPSEELLDAAIDAALAGEVKHV